MACQPDVVEVLMNTFSWKLARLASTKDLNVKKKSKIVNTEICEFGSADCPCDV